MPSLNRPWIKAESEPGKNVEIALPCRDGTVIYTDMTIVPLIINGETTGLISVFTDLTRHKKAKQQLKKSLDDRQQYATRLENLRGIDRVIMASHSSQEIAMSALKQIEHIINCDWARVTGFDSETKKEIVLATRFKPSHFLSEHPWARFSLHPETLLETEASLIHLPLTAGNKLIGFLSLGAVAPGKFNSESLEIAREMAAQLAIGIQHADLFEQVQQGQQRLQALSSSLLRAQEMERRRIARELHDEIGQAITALKISLQNLQTIPQAAEVMSQLEESINITHLTLQQVRTLSLELRPSMLDDLGLVAALRWYLDRVSNRAGLALHFTVDSQFIERLPSDLETVCFRLVQEALTNVVRHAKAEEVWVELKVDEANFFVSIQDDGVGFNVKEALEKAVNGSSMGLQGMLERVNLVKGDLKFSSSSEEGSFISAQFPIRLEIPVLNN